MELEDTSPAAKMTGAPIVAITVNATPARGPLAAASLCALRAMRNWGLERHPTELRRIAAKRGIYWPIDHQPHRLPARAAFSPSRAASWRQDQSHLVGMHSIPAGASKWRH